MFDYWRRFFSRRNFVVDVQFLTYLLFYFTQGSSLSTQEDPDGRSTAIAHEPLKNATVIPRNITECDNLRAFVERIRSFDRDPTLVELEVATVTITAVLFFIPLLKREIVRIWRNRRGHGPAPGAFFQAAHDNPLDVEQVGMDQRLAKMREDIAIYRQMIAKSPGSRTRDINAKITECENRHIDLDTPFNANWLPDYLNWRCPILYRVMSDPVRSPDGYCYERSALQTWYNTGARQAILNYHLPLPDPSSLPTQIELQVKIMNRLDEVIREAHVDAATPRGHS